MLHRLLAYLFCTHLCMLAFSLRTSLPILHALMYARILSLSWAAIIQKYDTNHDHRIEEDEMLLAVMDLKDELIGRTS
jgi:hypothetical protein